VLFDIGHWDLAPGITANEDSHWGVYNWFNIFLYIARGFRCCPSLTRGTGGECCLHIVPPTGSSRWMSFRQW